MRSGQRKPSFRGRRARPESDSAEEEECTFETLCFATSEWPHVAEEQLPDRSAVQTLIQRNGMDFEKMRNLLKDEREARTNAANTATSFGIIVRNLREAVKRKDWEEVAQCTESLENLSSSSSRNVEALMRLITDRNARGTAFSAEMRMEKLEEEVERIKDDIEARAHNLLLCALRETGVINGNLFFRGRRIETTPMRRDGVAPSLKVAMPNLLGKQ